MSPSLERNALYIKSVCTVPYYFIRPISNFCFKEFLLFCFSTTSQNSAVSLPIWLFKWSDFSTKRRNLSMQKSSRFVMSQTFWGFNWVHSNWLLNYTVSVKDVKFPLMLDVYELCTTELQEKMLPIRSKFKDVEDKKLEKQQQKVRQIYCYIILVAEKLPLLKVHISHNYSELFCFLH